MTFEKMQTLPRRPVGGATVAARVSGNEWSVELLRGLAALMVMYAHYYALAGLDRNLFAFFFTGVDLFFVISGFVFAPYFFGKGLAWRAFLIRRVFRIYPLYVAALCLYALQRWVSGQEVDHFLTHLFFLHTTQTREIAFHFNPAFWSLPPEVEFYLALPLLCALFAGVRGVARLWVLALAAHLVLVWGMGEAGGRGRAVLEIVLLHLPGLLVEFALGIVAWRAVAARPGTVPRLLLAVAGVAVVVGFGADLPRRRGCGHRRHLVAAWQPRGVGGDGLCGDADRGGGLGGRAAGVAALVRDRPGQPELRGVSLS